MWRRAPRKDEPEEEDRRDYRRSRGGSGAFPLYSEQELVALGPSTAPPSPGLPGELWIRLHVACPGCKCKARIGATPLHPAETRRLQVPTEE